MQIVKTEEQIEEEIVVVSSKITDVESDINYIQNNTLE